jgi:UDP-glucose 4-epimerase
MNDSRIVILGAAGFIGYHLSNFFKNKDLLLIDNFTNSAMDYEFKYLLNLNNIKFMNLDLSDENSFQNLFKANDLVLNCSALNGTQNFYSRPVEVIRNTAITAILSAEYSAKANVQKYVYFGSSESYSGGYELGLVGIPTGENVPFVIPKIGNMRSSYAASKSLGEISTIANSRQAGLPYIIVRIHNIYGPRMGKYHVIPDLIERFMRGDGGIYGMHETRSFMYIKDLVEIINLILFSNQIPINSVFNVGSENETPIIEVARLISEKLNKNIEYYSLGNFEGSVARRRPDTTLLKSKIKYFETDLKVGISNTVDWYLTHKK